MAAGRPSLESLLSGGGGRGGGSSPATRQQPPRRAASRAREVNAFLHRLCPTAQAKWAVPRLQSRHSAEHQTGRARKAAGARGSSQRRGRAGAGGGRGRGSPKASEPRPHPRCRANGASLELGGSGLGDEGVCELVDFLGGAGGECVTRLDLSSCQLSPEGCKVLARLLGSERCALTYLDLSGNPLCGMGFSGHDRQSTRADESGVVALAQVRRNL